VVSTDDDVHRPSTAAAAIGVIRASPLARSGIAVGAAVVAVLLRWGLEPVWGLELPYITLFPAIMLSAWLGGFWPGIVTTLLCAVAAAYLWIAPARSGAIGPADMLGLAAFVAVGGLISTLNEAWRRGTAAVVAAGQRLAESEARNAGILDAALDCIITMDHEGRVVDFNTAAERTFGYQRSEILGQSMADLIIPPALRHRHREGLARYLATGTARVLDQRLEMTAVRADGTELPAEISIVRLQVAGPALFTAHVRDISDRRRVERERATLIENERAARVEAERATEQLELALEAGRMGTWQWKIGSAEVEWSHGLEAIYGFTPGTFPGTFDAFEKAIHPDDRDRVRRALTAAADDERTYQIEYRVIGADGIGRWVESRGQLLRDSAGRPERMTGLCSDITERQQADEALKAKEAELQLVTSRTPLLLSRCSRDGRYAFVNRACAEFFGRPAEEIVGKAIPEILGDAAYATIGPYIGRVLSGEAVDFELEIPYAHAGRRFMRALYTPDRNERGDVVGWIATVTDITERKRVENDLRRTASLLEEANRAERAAKHEAELANHLKDQFLATVSHELRAPLNAVLGWAEMLRADALDESRRRRALQAVCANAKRQAALIDDLLDVSRIVSGKMQVTRSAVDLPAVVRAALESLQPSSEAKRIDVQADVDTSVGTVLGDAARLQQILSNLLTNAVKFSPESGAVRLTVRRRANVVEMIVSDNGIGIAPDFLPLVFDAFRQADGSTTRAHGGLGLGLAIVKHLVEAHGGTVAASSAGEGQGATFAVRLPITAAYGDASESVATASEIPGPGGGRSLTGVTGLVVDDDAESRELVTAILEDAGAFILSAGSAAAALAVLQCEQVDFLLADIAMPGEDGYSLIRKVRALESPSKARIPAAALTSLSGEGNAQRCLAAGFHLHIGKPVESRTLVDAVASMTRGTVHPRRLAGL
jgi:PAS domain S-box-containing protein